MGLPVSALAGVAPPEPDEWLSCSLAEMQLHVTRLHETLRGVRDILRDAV